MKCFSISLCILLSLFSFQWYFSSSSFFIYTVFDYSLIQFVCVISVCHLEMYLRVTYNKLPSHQEVGIPMTPFAGQFLNKNSYKMLKLFLSFSIIMDMRYVFFKELYSLWLRLYMFVLVLI